MSSSDSKRKTTYFSQLELEREVSAVTDPDRTEDLPEGWSRQAPDPMRLLKGFRRLEVKKGLVLRAYQYHSSGNGNGIVWALPGEAPFPPPEECEKLTNHFLSPPRPPDALDDFMQAIEGDQTAASYLAASFLCRELHELGAIWHGSSWSTHSLLYDDPLNAAGADRQEPGRRGSCEWTWKSRRPVKWLPRVTISAEKATVGFFTYSGCEREAIFRHTDTYRPGSLGFATRTTVIAVGGIGYIF